MAIPCKDCWRLADCMLDGCRIAEEAAYWADWVPPPPGPRAGWWTAVGGGAVLGGLIAAVIAVWWRG